MTTWGWNVIEFGTDFFEMLITCYLAYHLFGSQKERSSPARIKLFIFSLSGTTIQFISEQGLLPIPDLFPVVLTFLLYAVIVCRAKIIQALLWSLVNCFVLGIATISLSSLISLFLHTAVENLFLYSGYRIMFLVINKIAQLSITELIIRIVKRGKLQTSQRGGNALILFSLFSIFSLLLLWKIEYVQTPNIILFFNLFICVLLLCMNFSLMFFLSFVKKAAEEKRSLEEQNKLTAMQLRGQREIADLYASMRALKHDINAHLHTVHGYIQLKEYDKADRYMQRLLEDIQAITPFHTGNITLDALLGSKVDYAQRHHIATHVDASVPEVINILEDHLSVVMGNLLDNAIDASLKIEDEAKRSIDVKMTYINQNLLISIQNATNGQERRVGNLYLTTKEDVSEHGYGLKSIDRIIKLYGGFCQREHKDNMFTSYVRIPDCKPTSSDPLAN